MKKLFTLCALTISFNMNSQTGNTSTGTGSLGSLTSGGDYNVANGLESLPANTTGDRNAAYGAYSMYTNVSGVRNTAAGYHSLSLNVSGERNTAIGAYALYTNTGSRNTALGYQSLYYNTGDYNLAGGYQSLHNNTSGDYNAAFGYQSLYSNTTGNYNSAIGKSALYSNTTGEFNVAIGNRAGYSLTTGSNNSLFGSYAYVGSSSGSNRTVIGYDTSGQADNSVTLGNSDVTAIYMAQDSGATVYAAGLNLGGTAVTSTAAELNLLDGVTTVGSGILSSVTENSNTGVRLSTSNASNHGDIGSYAVDLSYSPSSSTSYGATGDYSIAMGYGSTASGIRSFAGGLYTIASGGGSFAFHSGTTASGTNSTALGRVTVASDYASLVIGHYNSTGSSATSANSFSTSAPAFVIGNGADASNKSDAFKVMFNGDATVSNDLTVSGDVNISSDARLKSNIVSLGSTLTKLLQIDGKSYEMKGKQKIGVLAQEIQEVFPELVSEDDNEMLAVNYQGLVPVLINALKEQDKIIKTQEERLSKIEEVLANLND